MSMGFQPGGRFRATNASVRELIALAYGTPQALPNFRIIGAPNWIAAERFDVEATAQVSPTQEVGRAMLRNLLADRFQLRAHSESRDLPILALVLAREDRRLGPQLTPSTADCAPLRVSPGNPPSPPPPPRPGEKLSCGISGGFGRIVGGSVTMAQFVTYLSRPVDRVVVDRTGLTGAFELDLTWTPDTLPNVPPGLPPPPFDPNGPSLFAALEEQLGLKVEATRGPVDVLVVDGVERPSPD
jgi:uncharacterized protein (TIGR03435 family)